MDEILIWMKENWFFTLTTVVSVASVIAAATPNETDNKVVAVLARIVEILSIPSKPTTYKGKDGTMG